MKKLLLTLVLSAPLFCARAEEVLPAELFYDPPEGYMTIDASSVDPSLVRKYVKPDSTPENHREISIGFALPEDTGGPANARNLTTLAKKLGEKLATLRTRELSAISETTLGGRRAVHASYRMSIPDNPLMPSLGMDVYWVPASRDRVLQIVLATTPADKLAELRTTLKSVRFQGPVEAAGEATLPATTGKVSLGDERTAVHSACGKPPVSGPSYDVYHMEPFVTLVSYSMPHVDSIQYYRPTDAGKLVTSIEASDKKAVISLAAPLTPDDVKAILARHAPTPDAWKPAGENRWERADGAVAFHWVKGKSLVLATKATWPKLSFPDPEE